MRRFIVSICENHQYHGNMACPCWYPLGRGVAYWLYMGTRAFNTFKFDAFFCIFYKFRRRDAQNHKNRGFDPHFRGMPPNVSYQVRRTNGTIIFQRQLTLRIKNAIFDQGNICASQTTYENMKWTLPIFATNRFSCKN